MDLSYSAEDNAFREEVRAFIKEAFTPDIMRECERSKNGYISKEAHITWQKRLHAKGWAAPNWPVEHGGAGFTPTQKFIYTHEMEAAGAPHTIPFGMTMVAPVIMKFGTEEQKAQYLPDILASNVWWCQGYSEPGSGSDLASLQMKAEDKGDHFLCNGSKIWTSMAQHADMIFCLVRTSNEGKRQQGISFLLIDMNTPGVSVAPLITLDGPAKDQQEINQVFFEDVKVPKENLLPNKSGLGAPLGCLDSARYGIAWGVIGAAMDCYDSALRYAQERIQFGKPIAAYQLTQKKLAEMITEITKAQLLT